MSFYSEMADVADDLITEFGQSVTLKVASGTSYNTSTGGVTVTYTDQIGHGCTVDFDKGLIDGEKVRIGDRLVLLSPFGLTEPTEGDKLIIGSDTWSIVPPVTVTNPAGTPVLYEVQVRK